MQKSCFKSFSAVWWSFTLYCLLFVVQTATPAAAQQGQMCTTFDRGDAGGWAACPTQPQITISTTNGNLGFDNSTGDASDFFLLLQDRSGASAACNSSAEMTGDWAARLGDCGQFCFDLKIFHSGSPPGPVTPSFSLHSGALRAFFKANFTVTPADPWTRICAPVHVVDPGEALPSNGTGQWFISGSNSYSPDWNTIISNVTRVWLPIDFSAQPSEVAGYDNFCFEGDDCGRNIPEPPRSCLRLDPEVECDKNGVISVTLHGSIPAGFAPDELEVNSLTPGVTVQPNYMSPVPNNPNFILNGASIGQEITLMTNAVDIGAGAIQGSDLCCSGLVKFRIPRDICQQPDPDLRVVKTHGACRPGAAAGHVCTFTAVVTDVGSGPFTGPLSITDTYTAPSASVFNASPPWICTNYPGSSSFTCNHPVTTLLPGQSVSLNYSLSVSGYRRGGRFQNCADLRPNLSTRGQVSLAQTLLNDAGYGAGTVDGSPGPRTRAAVLACQIANGQPPTGDYRDFLDFINAQSSVDANPGNNRSCVDVGLNPLPPPKVCPSGTTGTWPNCVDVVQHCPAGTTGTWPNCRDVPKDVCPTGTVGTWPNCIKTPTCPTGTVGTWPNCRDVPKACPTGAAVTWPNCVNVLQKCPTGTVGTWPNCRQVPITTCPAGTIGNWPNCLQVPTCPSGTVGNWPFCV